ncbi:hypothetical protein [Allostreptomyces psammosilenae]|uniref:Uncharacterized protein n=1 Tax=Allostreptomyces psammosilenae TaxID=1892865 RepID=A0A852ZUS0_9ACTN|nr:hypothetical protein [Allostreptomyces psammosilenae]NYI06019.1 hypothetical protein [Allostreptomyces psammosilenae]
MQQQVTPASTDPFAPFGGYEQELRAMVTDMAPRLFAVVQEYGERQDARIAAWGLAFRDHVEVVGCGGAYHLNLASTDSAARLFVRPQTRSRILWLDEAA